MDKIYLKKDKEKPVLHRHPWIFSGALAKRHPIEDGQIIAVCDSSGRHLGYGYFNSRSQIAVRMLSFGAKEVNREFLGNLIQSAYHKRRRNPLLKDTDSFRIIYSEGDALPGFILDNYGGHMVFQILTLGIERLRHTLIELILEILDPISIYERSDHSARIIEGLGAKTGQVFGSTPDEIMIHENDMVFMVDSKKGQKTGFYLDQRDNRALIRKLSLDRKVLNLFCYTGGFTVAAILGGAKDVLSIDSSDGALSMAQKNNRLNKIQKASIFLNTDVFHYVRKESIDSNLIIIDPPAFTKNRESINDACRGYKELNMQVIKRCLKGSFILTCSCSRFIDMRLFQKVIFAASADAGRDVSILMKCHQPADHPINIFHPESEYLKSLLLFVA